MKLLKQILVLCAFLTTAAYTVSAQAELQTVPYVDVSQYLGTWYQISHIPLIFEGGNCACARQVLSLGKQGAVDVYNSCNDKDTHGQLKEIRGEAYNDDPKSNSKFTVDFHLAFKGSYWIIGLDPQYRFAVVSDKNQYSLYILSKTPTLDPALYQDAIALAKKQLDVSKVVMTPQAGCTYPN